MTSPPAAVSEFVTAHLSSLEDLQVLMICIEGPGRWWDAGSMAREVGVAPGAARRSLDQLARRNLLDIRITDDVRYRFAPGTPELEATAQAVAAAYRRNPISIVQLVDTSRRSLRDFADAFRIRRDDDR